MLRIVFLLTFALALFSFFTGWNPFRTDSYRFKMTVEVQTPQGVRSGSGVYEVYAGHKTKLTAEEGSRYLRSRGEAVAIDIAPGKTLFTLLKTGAIHGDIGTMSMSAMDPAFRNDMPESIQRIRKRQGVRSPALVSANDYPMLVTFKDPQNPTSIVRVDPEHLSSSFGPGFRLKAITVTITDEPVTTGIQARLKWLDHLDRYQSDAKNPFTSTLSNEVGYLRSK